MNKNQPVYGGGGLISNDEVNGDTVRSFTAAICSLIEPFIPVCETLYVYKIKAAKRCLLLSCRLSDSLITIIITWSA